MKEPLLKVKSGEKVIVLDEDDEVVYSDFMPEGLRKGGRLKLFDVIGEENAELMKLLGASKEADTRQISGTMLIGGEWSDVRIVHVELTAEPARTHIFIAPFKSPKVNN